MDVNVTEENHIILIEVSGRIDSTNANEFGARLSKPIDDGHTLLVLDLAAVDYMSSAGLREIVSAIKRVRQDNGDVRLAQPSERVMEVLEISGLDSIFQIYPTQDGAMQSF